MTFEIYNMDCLDGMRLALPDNSVDSIVTDPPYGLTQARRAKPAPHIEGSPFSRHRVGVNGDTKPIGGFMGNEWDSDVPSVEIWAECLRVLKPGGHLLAFAGTRTQHRMATRIEDAGFEIRDMIAWVYGSGFPKSRNIANDMDNCTDWQGWGTALKPAMEPITVARKPLIGTVAENVLAHGTGALNIDGCRVEHVTVDGGSLSTNPHLRSHINGGNGGHIIASEAERRVVIPNAAGRWPANLIHDGSEEILTCFPGSGDAARFFYCPKASRKERGDGNSHPTVKPIDLMAYLCRLVTPVGGISLDPFMGSGSTGIAALREGFNFIGFERDAAYHAIAMQRLMEADNRE